MEADKKYLVDLTATCKQKAADIESRQPLCAKELEAIAKAIEIISSSAVQGSADKHLPALAQKGQALAMLRSDMSSQIVLAKAAQYLRDRASQLNSRVLSALRCPCRRRPLRQGKEDDQGPDHPSDGGSERGGQAQRPV
jgi:hypothetical protein